MKNLALLLFLSLVLFLSGCLDNGSSDDDSSGSTPDPEEQKPEEQKAEEDRKESDVNISLPEAPINIEINYESSSPSLAWSKVDGVEMYIVYYSRNHRLGDTSDLIRSQYKYISSETNSIELYDFEEGYFYYFYVVSKKDGAESKLGIGKGAVLRGEEYLLDERFKPVGRLASKVIDTKTGLIWQRCATSQTWNPVTQNCDGEAYDYNQPNWWESVEMYGTWDDITEWTEDEKRDLNFPLPENEWRMPTSSQLATLIYCSTGNYEGSHKCIRGRDLVQPTTFNNAFPNTTSVSYFTGSPVWNEVSQVSFNFGGIYQNSKSGANPVRLVKVTDNVKDYLN